MDRSSTHTAPGASQPPSPAEVEAALERVLASGAFGAARQLHAFLRFVVEGALRGEAERIKEYTIATEVLGRGPGFDPKQDGVVRTQAGVLRKRLAAYYEGEGRSDPIRIDVPRGGYVPTFARAPAPSARAAGSDAAPAGVSRGRVRQILIAVALVDAIALAGVVAYLSLRPSASEPAAGRPREAAIGAPSPWDGFLAMPGSAGPAPTVLAFGAPQFFEHGGLLVRDVSVNAPDAPAPRLRAIEQALGGPLEPTDLYTGIGETTGAVRLAQFFARHGRDLRVSPSRDLSLDDVKDAHLVFVASLRFHTRADDLGLPSDFTLGLPDGAIVNRRPAPGEASRYMGSRTVDHAVVTRAPGKTPGRHVLVLAGRTTWGTQAAAEFVTRPEHLAMLTQALEACRQRTGRAAHPDTYQLLLEVELADRQPLAVKLITHHDL